MTRKLAYALGFGLLLLGAALFARDRLREDALRGHALAAAQRGAAWLLAHDAPFEDPAIPWILSLVNDEYCQSPALGEFVARRFAEFDRAPHPVYPALRSGFSPAAREDGFRTFWKLWSAVSHEDDVLSAMAYGVYCDHLPMPEFVAETMYATDAKRYVLTHQYLALLFMKRFGCAAEQRDPALRHTAQALVAEQEDDPAFSDLYVERVAVLLHGDERSAVDPAWIETIVASQEASGAWSDLALLGRVYPNVQNPHTTALAVWALAEHTGACPFQNAP